MSGRLLPLRWPLCVAVVLHLSFVACASLGSPGIPVRYSQNVISENEVTMTHLSNVYDVVQRLRPGFLVSGRDPASVGERMVYLNGMHIGGIEELRRMGAAGVREIRLLSAGEAIRLLGPDHRGGALLISARPPYALERL